MSYGKTTTLEQSSFDDLEALPLFSGTAVRATAEEKEAPACCTAAAPYRQETFSRSVPDVSRYGQGGRPVLLVRGRQTSPETRPRTGRG